MGQRRILIVTNRVPYPLNDGGNLAMNAMVDGYHNSGWAVYLLSMNTSRHPLSADTLSGLYKHIHAFEWIDINNDISKMNVVKNYFFSKEAEHVERFYKKEFENRLIDVINDFSPDVIQMESVYLSSYLPAIRATTDAVKVLRMHNIEYHIWHGLASKTSNAIKKRYYATLADRLKKFECDSWVEYDLILTITDKDAFHVRRQVKVADMLVAPFGLEMDKISARSQNERWVGYHIGAMDWIPNRDGIRWFLNDVWPKIHNTIPKFEFYFAGRKMPREFRELNIQGVYCMDEVRSAPEFIADKKILIVPISSSGGIRVKILEAMAVGKVVISSPEGIKGIDAKSGEHFLLARKPEEYVRAIKWCMLNKQKAEEMGEKARQLVTEQYEYRAVTKLVIDEIEALLKLRHSPLE